MARLKAVTTLEIDTTGFDYQPSTTWYFGPGNPALLELLDWQLELRDASVIDEKGESYLRWHAPTMPTEEELLTLGRKISEAILEIHRKLSEFRLLHQVVMTREQR